MSEDLDMLAVTGRAIVGRCDWKAKAHYVLKKLLEESRYTKVKVE